MNSRACGMTKHRSNSQSENKRLPKLTVLLSYIVSNISYFAEHKQ